MNNNINNLNNNNEIVEEDDEDNDVIDNKQQLGHLAVCIQNGGKRDGWMDGWIIKMKGWISVDGWTERLMDGWMNECEDV